MEIWWPWIKRPPIHLTYVPGQPTWYLAVTTNIRMVWATPNQSLARNAIPVPINLVLDATYGFPVVPMCPLSCWSIEQSSRKLIPELKLMRENIYFFLFIIYLKTSTKWTCRHWHNKYCIASLRGHSYRGLASSPKWNVTNWRFSCLLGKNFMVGHM